jgi:hypothetical protein
LPTRSYRQQVGKVTFKGEGQQIRKEESKALISVHPVRITRIPVTIKSVSQRVLVTLKIERVNLDENPRVFTVSLLYFDHISLFEGLLGHVAANRGGSPP